MLTLADGDWLRLVGHHDKGTLTCRKVNVEGEGFVVGMPEDANETVCTLQRSMTPGEVTHRVRGDSDSFAMTLDTEEIRHQQIVQVTHHEVVHGSTMLGVPLLSQRGMADLNLIAVARHVVVVEHQVEQLLLTIVDKGVKEVTVAYVACRQTVAVLMDVSNEIL